MDAALIDDAFTHLLAGDEAAARAAFAAAQRSDDAATAWLGAAGTLVAVAGHFADFRGLDVALAGFAAGCEAAPALAIAHERALDRARIDAAWLAWPSLDHDIAHDEPRVAAARSRLFDALRNGAVPVPDEQVLLAKLLVDYDGMFNDQQVVERTLAMMQDAVRRASPVWQGYWWLLVAGNAEYWGRQAAADEATQQAQALAERHDLKALRFELQCAAMQAALRNDDLARADRAFVQIEQLRPHVAPGRVPHGLRAQASLLIRRGEYRAALERITLLLAICEDCAVPERDRGAYHVQRANALIGAGRHAEALAVLEALRPQQKAGQAEMLDTVIAVARAAQALDTGDPQLRPICADALRRCAVATYSRFLMPLPALAARIAEIGLDDGVEVEFLQATIRDRRLVPPDPQRAHWPWRLHLRALGELQVQRDGVVLATAGAKAQKKPLELLAMLVAAGGAPVDGSTLIDALWPSLEANAPKASLEMAVSRLRKLLDLPDAVLVDGGAVRLHPALVWTDVAAFEAAAGQAAEGDEAAAGRALALYRGCLLGSEKTLNATLQAARERLALRLAQTLADQGTRLESRGDWAAATRLYERGLLLDPAAETLYRALMRAQLAQGEQAEALRTYRRCATLLHSLLGAAPSAQTRALAQQAGAV